MKQFQKDLIFLLVKFVEHMKDILNISMKHLPEKVSIGQSLAVESKIGLF